MGFSWFWLVFIIAVVAVLVIIRISLFQQKRGLTNLGIAVLGMLSVLAIMTVVSSQRVNYSYASYERPNELLIYSQTGQETVYAAECIEKLASQSGLGSDISILVGESDNFSWQWRWYLRKYPNVKYQSLIQSRLTTPPLADVVTFSNSVKRAKEQNLKGFIQVGDLSHLWWFPNYAYEDLSIKSVISDMTSRAAWISATDYFFSRTMRSMPYRSEGSLYVTEQLSELAIDCTSLRASDSQ